jgi:hypothetical protein
MPGIATFNFPVAPAVVDRTTTGCDADQRGVRGSFSIGNQFLALNENLVKCSFYAAF